MESISLVAWSPMRQAPLLESFLERMLSQLLSRVGRVRRVGRVSRASRVGRVGWVGAVGACASLARSVLQGALSIWRWRARRGPRLRMGPPPSPWEPLIRTRVVFLDEGEWDFCSPDIAEEEADAERRFALACALARSCAIFVEGIVVLVTF